MSLKQLETLYNSGFLKYLDQSECLDFLEHADIVERTFRRGQPIFLEGDTINRVCIVAEGSVRSEKTYANGVIHLLTIFEENSIFGLEIVLSHRRTSPVDFIANEMTKVLFVSVELIVTDQYRKLVEKALTEMMADENIRMMHKIEILAERGLRDRVIVYLNVLARRTGSNVVSVRMNREQLASYLGVNRSALSNELSKMKSEGIIDFTRYQFRLMQYNDDGTAK